MLPCLWRSSYRHWLSGSQPDGLQGGADMEKKLCQIFLNALLILIVGAFLGLLWKAVEYHHSHTDCKGGDCEWYWCPKRTR